MAKQSNARPADTVGNANTQEQSSEGPRRTWRRTAQGRAGARACTTSARSSPPRGSALLP